MNIYKTNKLIILLIAMVIVVRAYDPITQKSINLNTSATNQTAHISPEIVNELKDFKTLIPTATIDEIVAKHYLVDKNFRIALNYLRSQDFTQLQKQLLNIPEIIDILKFLQLTIVNATTSHMGATKTTTTRVKVSIDDYSVVDDTDADNRIVKMTTNTGPIISKPNVMTVESIKGTLRNKKVHKRPQHFQMPEEHNKNVVIDVDDDVNAIARIYNEQQPLVHFVLLEDLEVHNYNHHNRHYHYKYHHQRNNNYHHHDSLGTFTTFVEEVLQYLPHSAYQNMIMNKCKENAKFADFYKALRSLEFKPLVDEAMLSTNIKQIIKTLNYHQVDVKSLEPVVFKVISWGPNI